MAPLEEEDGFVFVGAGTASGFAFAGTAAPPVGAEATGVTPALGADAIELARLGGVAGFSAGGLAACPADSEASCVLAWAVVAALPPINCSGPALARISFTWLGFVSNGEYGKFSIGRPLR